MDKTNPSSSKSSNTSEEWQTITFSKKKASTKQHQSLKKGKRTTKEDQTQIKIYGAASGKFLNPNSFTPITNANDNDNDNYSNDNFLNPPLHILGGVTPLSLG